EVSFPHAVVGGVHHVVAIAVGGQVAAGHPQRVPPHGVVGCVDHAIAVVVAGEREIGGDGGVAKVAQKGQIERGEVLPGANGDGGGEGRLLKLTIYDIGAGEMAGHV